MRKFWTSIFLVYVSITMGACSYVRMTMGEVRLSLSPAHRQDAEAIKQANPDECGVLMGSIVSDKSTGVMFAIVAFSEDLLNIKPADFNILSEPGPYMLYVPRGRYRIVAFADFNKNRVFDQNELVGRLNNPGIVAVDRGQVISGLDFSVAGKGSNYVESPVDIQLPDTTEVVKKAINQGGAVRLDDRIFSREYGSMGLWSPAQFIHELGVNIYAPEKYDNGKIPILFVHGSGGTPRDWEYLAGNIDRTRFQLWFFFYPSGLRLETISGLLYENLSFLYKTYGFSTLYITAHSMGGLIVRSFFNRYALEGPPYSVKLFVSISTPWNGVESAQLAPEKSLFKGPPVWQDLAPESPFLKTLYHHHLPSELNYYLFFGYRSYKVFVKKAEDGVIALESQLYPTAQSEATKCFGFNENHASILSCKNVVEQYVQVLIAAYTKSLP